MLFLKCGKEAAKEKTPFQKPSFSKIKSDLFLNYNLPSKAYYFTSQILVLANSLDHCGCSNTTAPLKVIESKGTVSHMMVHPLPY